jgi:hypothetical protein
MNSIWARAVVACGLLGLPAGLAAQRSTEIGAQAVVTSANPTALVGGGYGALWAERRVRIAATAGVGVQDEAFAWRLEALTHFHLNPESPGIGVYGGGGLALAGGVRTQGYLVLILGLEQAPRDAHGWAVELGVGGGVRVSVGYRWRRH